MSTYPRIPKDLEPYRRVVTITDIEHWHALKVAKLDAIEQARVGYDAARAELVATLQHRLRAIEMDAPEQA